MKINWLVAGIGDVAVKRVFPVLAVEPRSTLYGVVTRYAGKGRRYVERVWSDGHRLADPAIDAVYIATLVFLRCAQAVMALRGGKHVLCEKPMALNLLGALKMVLTAEDSGKLLGIAFFQRMYPPVREAIFVIWAVRVEVNYHGANRGRSARVGRWPRPS